MINHKPLLSILLGLLLLASTPPARAESFPALGIVPREGGFRMEGYWVWDGSVIKAEDGRYHMFASRWPKQIAFHPGWMVYSEVVRAVSDTPQGPFEFQEVVLPARGAEYWDGCATHNPSITRHGTTYILYYMGSTHPLDPPELGQPFPLSDPRCIVARSNKRIGVATAPSVEGPWTRLDQPVLDTQPGTFYSYLTSNPSPVVHEDGSVLLMFKSRRYEGHRQSSMMLGVARAPHYLGPYQVVSDGPVFGRDRLGEVEDPFVWKTETGYAMIAKDMSGALSGERHAGIMALSEDGLNWRLADQPKAWSRRITWSDGTEQVLGQLERPFVLMENGRPAWLYAACGDGPGGFSRMTSSFTLCIPLVQD